MTALWDRNKKTTHLILIKVMHSIYTLAQRGEKPACEQSTPNRWQIMPTIEATE